ncbi:MAG: NUDIX domain-containing protein [Firmicutes bacterium]|nr:NUDIX domain-containing protein [Bacillota bacterium]
MQIHFHKFFNIDEIADDLIKFVVIAARYNDKWIFCKHKDRTTWEIPGGKRETGETILEASRRELFEETGTVDAEITPICIFTIIEDPTGYGLLSFAEINEISDLPQCEMTKIGLFDEMPTSQTYINVHPLLMQRVLQALSEG